MKRSLESILYLGIMMKRVKCFIEPGEIYENCDYRLCECTNVHPILNGSGLRYLKNRILFFFNRKAHDWDIEGEDIYTYEPSSCSQVHCAPITLSAVRGREMHIMMERFFNARKGKKGN